ncbi:MAG TPA: aminodeoxychorismate synthase component I [Tepidisphaeraceae bacterium]|nr:aminodeoxychorismate synthase component I [Tepidisphaeraceae bacterium]
MIRVEEIESGREAFETARMGEDRFRLDSGGEGRWSRWSYRAANPSLMLKSNPDGITLLAPGGKRWTNPLDALAWMDSTTKQEPVDGPPFKGGWLGHLSYDLGRWFEELPSKAGNDLGWPFFVFAWHERVIAHDGTSGRNYLCSAKAPVPGNALDFGSSEWPIGWGKFKSNFSREEYERAVVAALEYIAAGDVFQVNLSQRFEMPMALPPRAVYQRMCGEYPAGFGALLDYGNRALISNSPELFLQVDGRKVTTRPIKGTRPRREGMEKELRASPKDQAELNMIVDLERNDLGRICELGSVKVTSARDIETLPTVYHGVATIEGILREDVGLVELLRATFPGGSVTGAPKIRAMQIIDEVEPVRRGAYCGAIGYLSADGQIGLNIAIRTIVADEGRAYVSVGGGIVADSKPAEEYEETMIKAQAMFEVLK